MRPGTSKPYNLQACEIPNSWASLETRPVANTERRLGTPSPERARLNPSCFFPSKPAAANLELCVPTVSKHAVVLHLRDPYDEVHSSQTCKVPQSRRLPRVLLNGFLIATSNPTFWLFGEVNRVSCPLGEAHSVHRRGGNFSHSEFAVVASGTATVDRKQSASLGLQLAGATPFASSRKSF